MLTAAGLRGPGGSVDEAPALICSYSSQSATEALSAGVVQVVDDLSDGHRAIHRSCNLRQR